MKKLRLSLDALAVESFQTTPVMRRGSGTVEGHEASTFCPTDDNDKVTAGGASCQWSQCLFDCTDDMGTDTGTDDTYTRLPAQTEGCTLYDATCASTCDGPTCEALICIPL